ncbi:MAG: hypothetical protein LLF28_04305 [Nitrospiraceae bacterium]|nr:hypothetical protein [Nitrospiraceae bacterium]
MKKIFIENLGLKILAVSMAIILWFFVVSKGQSEIAIDVPIELKNIPQGLECVKQNTKSVSLTIRGQEIFLKNAKPADINVYIDLGKAKKGRSAYFINKDDVKLPSTMHVLSISPSSITIDIEETATAKVLVIPVVTGTPDPKFIVKSIEVSPKEVTIEGVSSEINGMTSIRTEPVDITGSSRTFTKEIRLETNGRNIRVKQDVRIKIVLKERKK